MKLKYRNAEIRGRIVSATIDNMTVEITHPYQNLQNRTDYYYNNDCHLSTNPKFKQNNKLTEYGEEVANTLLKHLYIACRNTEKHKEEIKDIISSSIRIHEKYYKIINLIKSRPSPSTVDDIVRRFINQSIF